MADGVRSRKLQDLKAALIAYISSGVFAAGDKLPSEIDLMQQFSVGRDLLRHALRELRTEGVIITEPRQGSTVKTATPTYTELRTPDDPTALIEPTGQPLEQRDITDPEAATVFGLTVDEPFFYLESKGRHRVNGAPAITARTLPVASLLGIRPRVDPFGKRGAILDALAAHHGPLTLKDRVRTISAPTAETATMLGMTPETIGPVTEISRHHRAKRAGRLLMLEVVRVPADALIWEFDL